MASDANALLVRIGRRIVQRREELGLAQKDLAERLAMHSPGLSDIEHGQRNLTVRTICKLAKALGMTPEELFTGKPADPSG